MVVYGAALFCSAPAPAQSGTGQLHAFEQLVPPRSRHHFIPIAPTWSKREEYLIREGLNLLPGNRSTAFRQVTYFTRKQAGYQSDYVKQLSYDEDGRLIKEADQMANDRYERDFYPNHSIANYLHWHKGEGVIAGYSLDPGGKTIARIQNGRGEIITWVSGPGDLVHSWVYRGEYVLTKSFSHRILIAENYCATSGDTLYITPVGKQLTLKTQREIWTEPEQGALHGQVLPGSQPNQISTKTTPGAPAPPSDEIHVRLLASGPEVGERPAEKAAAAVSLQRVNDYRSRRDAFLKEYTADLLAAGQYELLADPETSFESAATRELESALNQTTGNSIRKDLLVAFYTVLSHSHEKLAVITLISGGYSSAVPADLQAEVLMPLLQDPDRQVRLSALRVLGFVANRCGESFDAQLAREFASMLESDPSLRPDTLRAIGLTRRKELAESVSRYLVDKTPAVRAEAAFSLAILTAPSTTYQVRIAALLEDADRNVRQRAVSALYTMNAKSAEPFVEKMLGDRDPLLRIDAIRMLVLSHAVQASGAIQLLSNDPDERVRKEVDAAIKLLGTG